MPSNHPAAVTAVALMLILWGQYSPAQERITGGADVDPMTGRQGGWVIEIGGDEQTPQSESQYGTQQTTEAPISEPVRQGGAGIEIIIGGQGNGGVAKKGTLPVID